MNTKKKNRKETGKWGAIGNSTVAYNWRKTAVGKHFKQRELKEKTRKGYLKHSHVRCVSGQVRHVLTELNMLEWGFAFQHLDLHAIELYSDTDK